MCMGVGEARPPGRGNHNNLKKLLSSSAVVIVEEPMPAWFVYLVRCRDGSLYTGIARDVNARVAAHNQGRGARYTRGRRPVALLHVERKKIPGLRPAARGGHQGAAPQGEAGASSRGGSRVTRIMFVLLLLTEGKSERVLIPAGIIRERIQSRR